MGLCQKWGQAQSSTNLDKLKLEEDKLTITGMP
jgi:hypothetical protein